MAVGGGEGIVFLSPPLFVFALCLVSFLGVGWVVLVGGGFVLGVVGVRGERGVSTGSGGVSCGCAIVLARIFSFCPFMVIPLSLGWLRGLLYLVGSLTWGALACVWVGWR